VRERLHAREGPVCCNTAACIKYYMAYMEYVMELCSPGSRPTALLPANKLVSLTWILWGLRSFRIFTLHYIIYITLLPKRHTHPTNPCLSEAALAKDCKEVEVCGPHEVLLRQSIDQSLLFVFQLILRLVQRLNNNTIQYNFVYWQD